MASILEAAALRARMNITMGLTRMCNATRPRNATSERRREETGEAVKD